MSDVCVSPYGGSILDLRAGYLEVQAVPGSSYRIILQAEDAAFLVDTSWELTIDATDYAGVVSGSVVVFDVTSPANTGTYPLSITRTDPAPVAEVIIGEFVSTTNPRSSSGTGTATISISNATATATVTVLGGYMAVSGGYGAIVDHGGDAGVARPTTTRPVLWRGTVEPTNAIDGDDWLNYS